MTRTDTRPVELPAEEQETAGIALARIRGFLTDHRDAAKVAVKVEGEESTPLTLPREAVELLASMLAHMAAGRGVSVVPQNAELTTQQAADLLNVSRPFLIGLLNAGEISYRTVGKHRRITAASLMQYKRQDDERRRGAADELSRLNQEMGLD